MIDFPYLDGSTDGSQESQWANYEHRISDLFNTSDG